MIHTGGGHFLAIPSPMPRALEARVGLRHSDLADADGGRLDCPGRLYRVRQHPSERSVGICANWRCRACGASIRLDRATGAVRLDTSRAETTRVMSKERELAHVGQLVVQAAVAPAGGGIIPP